jgi:AraC family transcriptional regulator
MELEVQGRSKYGDHDLLASSDGARWDGIALEHRRHPKGEISSFQPQHLEIAIATDCHPDCIVSRTGDRVRQHSRVEPGTLWFCPGGILEEDIEISEWHEVLHIYLPERRFAQLAETCGGAAMGPENIPYLGGFYNEALRRIGTHLLDQLQSPGAAASLLVDTLSLDLAACVVGTYSGAHSHRFEIDGDQRLDNKRMRRVLDYMTAHIGDEIGLDDLAEAACFSAFHFSRVFRNTCGVPPFRYLSRLRLERAKTLLTLGTMPIAEIALACCFASQSNFTRAFRRATGLTPQVYRGKGA